MFFGFTEIGIERHSSVDSANPLFGGEDGTSDLSRPVRRYETRGRRDREAKTEDAGPLCNFMSKTAQHGARTHVCPDQRKGARQDSAPACARRFRVTPVTCGRCGSHLRKIQKYKKDNLLGISPHRVPPCGEGALTWPVRWRCDARERRDHGRGACCALLSPLDKQSAFLSAHIQRSGLQETRVVKLRLPVSATLSLSLSLSLRHETCARLSEHLHRIFDRALIFCARERHEQPLADAVNSGHFVDASAALVLAQLGERTLFEGPRYEHHAMLEPANWRRTDGAHLVRAPGPDPPDRLGKARPQRNGGRCSAARSRSRRGSRREAHDGSDRWREARDT